MNSASSPAGDGSLIAGQNGSNWEGTLPPLWVENVADIDQFQQEITLKMKQLDKVHARRLMPRFDDSEGAEEREIECLTQDVAQLFRDCEQALKKIDKSDDGRALSEADQKLRQNIKITKATQLQALTMTFRRQQKDFVAKLQAQKQGPAGSLAIDFFDESNDNGFSDSQMSEMATGEVNADERDQEIQKIAKAVEELATMFKELAVLVIDQGTILDRIDYNMDMAVERTEQGMAEITKAEATQKSSRPMKCMVLLLVLIAIMLGILVSKHSKSASGQ